MPELKGSKLVRGEIFTLGWFYDRQEAEVTLRAHKNFDLQEVSQGLIATYPPKSKKWTVRAHIEHLRDELLLRGLATPVNVRQFCHPRAGEDLIAELDQETFYSGE